MKKIIVLFAFIAIVINASSQNVIRGEYFIDADPGFGSATPFVISLPDSDITQAINIPYSAFPAPGYHYVYIRTMDANGSWNLTAKRIVEADDNPYSLNVIKVEYFFDVDNGFESNAFKQVTASGDSTWNFNIPFNQLPLTWTLNDTLFLRVQDSAGTSWSLTTMIDSLNFTMVGINELTEATGVIIYPNPFVNEIMVSEKNNQKMRLALYSESGQLIFDKVIKHPTKINTELLAPGAYIIFVRTDDQKIYRSVVIKH